MNATAKESPAGVFVVLPARPRIRPTATVPAESGWTPAYLRLPAEKEIVAVRVRGTVRHGYYRIDDRWYRLRDLDRWRMNSSPYWNSDRAWYLRTDQVDAWREEKGSS